MDTILLYGANGYTGNLLAREAVRREFPVIFAGRNAEALAKLGKELNREYRCFDLGDPARIDEGLKGVAVVLHCAGPFSHTARAMVEACLRTSTHYLDITGEIAVFEALHRCDQEAKKVGIMLLPGVGFDVVPTDCLAAHLKRKMPRADHLALAIQALHGGLSRGTATTMLENAHRGGMIRKDGKLMGVPAAWKNRAIDFGSGPEPAITIPWGDVSTAFYSTGIPNIEVYMAAPAATRLSARMSRYFGWLIGSPWVQTWMKRRIHKGKPGPTEEERKRGETRVWGEVIDPEGKTLISRLQGPEGYTFTMLSALSIAERVCSGQFSPGFQTPSLAYGPDFVLEIPGVQREDLLPS